MIYLNNATTAFPRSEVALAAFDEAARRPPADVRNFPDEASDIWLYRQRAAAAVGTDAAFLFFVPDATFGLNAVLRGYLRPGDTCILDNRPHNAVLRTVDALAGVVYAIAELHDPDERTDPNRLLRLITPSTRLDCLTHVSNVSGSVYDLGSVLVDLRRRFPDVAVLVDAAQSAGCIDLSQAIEADFVVFPAHKHLCSVPGAAILVAKRPLRPLLTGGTGRRSRLLRDDDGSHFMEVGTPNSPAIAAMVAALEDWAAHSAAYASAVATLQEQLWAALEGMPGLTLLGRPPGDRRTGIVAMATQRSDPEADWVPFLRAAGIIVRGGLHCSPVHHDQLGLRAGTLRLSIGRFNTSANIDDAAAAIRDFAGALTAVG